MDLSTHVQHPLPNLSVRKITLLQRRGVGNWWRKIRSMPSNIPLESVVKSPPPSPTPLSTTLLTLLVMEI